MDFNKIIKENAINIMLLVLLINYGFIHFFVIQASIAAAALQDYGFISVLTVVAILSAELIVIWNFTQAKGWKEKIPLLLIAFILQIYLCREADLHTFFTDGHSVTNLKYYKRMEYSLLSKLIAAPILILFFSAFGYIILRYGLFTIKAFFRGEPWAVAFAIWGALLVGSQILDRMNLPETPWRPKLFEEYMEFSASVYMPAVVLLYKFRNRITKKN